MRKITTFFLFLTFMLCMFFVINTDAKVIEASELLNLRTRTEKVFSLSNGNYQYVQYAEPIHYFENGKYVEYDLRFDAHSKDSLSIKSSDYNVTYKGENTSDITAEISFYGQNKLTFILPNHLKNKDIKNKITKNSPECNQIQLGQLSLSAYTNKLSIEQTIFLQKQDKIEYLIQVDEDLDFVNEAGTYMFINQDGRVFYNLSDVLLKDSNNLITNNNQINISHIENNIYKIDILLNVDFMNDSKVEYPLQMQVSTNYNYYWDHHFIRDKVFVKDTGLQHDSMVFQVAKSKYVFFDPDVEPVNLSQYHHYGLMEIDIRGLIPIDNMVSADLVLTQIDGNTNDSIPLSKITSHNYDAIDGYVNYNKTNIQTKTIVNGKLIYDVYNILNEALANEEHFLLLELSPSNIDLGSSNNKYKKFASINEESTNSTMLIVEFELIDSLYSTYGSAGFYEPVESPFWKCLEYVIRTELEQDYIQNGYGQNIFTLYLNRETFQFNFDYEQDVVDAIYWTMVYANFGFRKLDSYEDDIYHDEYRIAFRLGNTSNSKTFNMTPSGIWDNKWDDYHFMMQHSDGRWSHKNGNYISRILEYEEHPDMNIWHTYKDNYLSSSYIVNFYDSDTYYFAIKPL